jgi:hypothetical protein
LDNLIKQGFKMVEYKASVVNEGGCCEIFW